MASEDDRDQDREGPEAARRFETTLKRIVSVAKTELVKREAAYKKSRQAKRSRASKTP